MAKRERAWRWFLFVALVVLLPVPMLLFDGRVPTANLYLMSAVCAAFWAHQGAAGPVRTVTLRVDATDCAGPAAIATYSVQHEAGASARESRLSVVIVD